MREVGDRLVRLASWRVLLALALVLGVLGMQSGRGTLAYFTSTATSTNNSFAAGTVVLQVADTDEPTFASTVTGSVSVASSPGMAPGDTTKGFIDVKNTGTLGLRYALSTSDTTVASTANTALRDALTVGVDSIATSASCANTQGGSQTQVIAAGTALKTLAFGSSTQGAQAGDRNLTTGSSERLCFYVTFPLGSSADNTAQGGAASFTFNFNGEQTANNP